MSVKTGLLFMMVVFLANAVYAVDGIAVSAHWTEGGDNNIYGNFGVIMRYDIENDEVVRAVQISAGPGRQPVISPDGKMVAYLHQNNDVRLLTIDGQGEKSIATAHAQGCIQFPLNEWVYYDTEEPLSHETNIKRTHISTAQTEQVLLLNKGVWRWGVASDGKKFMMRFGEGSNRGIAYWDDLSNPPTDRDQIFANKLNGGCGLAFGASGKYWADHGGHDALRVYDFGKNTDPYIDSKLGDLQNWGEDTGYRTNRNNWSRNSDDWICFAEGWGYRGTTNRNLVLYNWKEQYKINVTKNSEENPGNNDCGDFWVGSVAPPPQHPVLNIDKSSLSFSVSQGGPAASDQTVAITNSGVGTLESIQTQIAYQPQGDWLELSVSGSGNSQKIGNALATTSLETGTYTAVVTLTSANATPSSITYEVTLDILQPPVVKSITVVPQKVVVLPGATKQFTATAYDQYDQPLSVQPEFTWAVSNNQTILPSGVFQAQDQEGGPFTITATVISGESTIQGQAIVDVSSTPVSEQGYITQFLTLQKEGSVYLPQAAQVYPGGIESAVPAAEQVVQISGQEYVWTQSYDDDGYWSDETARDGFVSYWAITLVSTVSQQSKLVTRHDDKLDAWVNGEPVLSYSNWDGGNEKVSPAFDLQPGANTVLFRLQESSRENMFAAKFTGSDGENLTNVTYSLGAIKPIVMTSPGGGETYSVGEQVSIRWVADTSNVGNVSIFFSTNNLSWNLIHDDTGISTADPRWGNFTWTIPDILQSPSGNISTVAATCYIKITDYARSDILDQNEVPFAITSSSSTVKASRVGMKQMDFELSPGAVVLSPRLIGGRIILYQSSGRVVFNKVISSAVVSLEQASLRSGLYVVRILSASGESLVQQPVVIQK